MREYSVLIGGQAGDGINQAGLLLTAIFTQMGYRAYMYFDYPSLIRGGHNFAIVRCAERKVYAHHDRMDLVIALNQETVDLHVHRLEDPHDMIFDAGAAKARGTGIDCAKILAEEHARPVMRNSCLLGAFAHTMGIDLSIVEQAFRKNISKSIDLNLTLARRGYAAAVQTHTVPVLEQPRLPVLTGNEAMGLGMINAGLNAYVAYPMTPSSNLLHYLAGNADEYGLTVMHPESEIAVILMALGFSYAGKKAAVGTSGGGFCLMTESLSLAGMAEIPVVVVLGQRPGPSTGVPTHTAQEDLQFALSAGQGEFVRLVVAPGDAEQAFTLAALALNTAWKYQIPAIVISDTALSEGTYTFERTALPPVLPAEPLLWNGEGEYARYRITENGVSPMTFPSDKRAVVKVSSYEHDEQGLTTDRAPAIAAMYAKRLRKEAALRQELTSIEQVVVSGNTAASIALVCWGSNKGVCDEVARRLELRAVQTLVMAPFPVEKYRAALEGVTCCIVVESNATGQFARLSEQHGFRVDEHVLKYDGRPFSVEELEAGVRDVLAARIPISAGT